MNDRTEPEKSIDDAEISSPATELIKAKKKKKRALLIALAAAVLLGAASYVLVYHPELFEFDSNDNTVTSMYSDKINSYVFYPTDYDLDVTADETYMGLDRYVYYKNGGETIAVTDGDYAQYGEAVEFFGTYFETVIAGDAETYNTYFTDNYYETNVPYDRFAPQMLYDILVECISETTSNSGVTTYGFDVSYKIHRNDGTFRNDLDSDSSKKLYFELIAQNGEVRIDRISYYIRITE